MHRFIYFILIITALASCRLETETEDRGPLHIVTTTGIIEDGVEHIVQDSAEVTSIMGPGTDPHIYKPTPSDIELMDDADVIIANGLHLEGKMSDMLKQYGEEKPVIFVSDGLAKKDLIKSADFEDSFDPHIWFDWKLWMEGMSYVTEELGKIDTLSKSYFEDNYKDYESDVRQTHLDVEDYIQEIPEEKRVLITSHDAFSYFGRRYNVEVRGIQGISTLSEVGLKDISDMVDFVIEKEIRSIFVETSTSDKTAQSIVDGCKDKGYELKLDGPLYSDALGEPDSEGGSYVGMILANAKTIAEGLKE